MFVPVSLIGKTNSSYFSKILMPALVVLVLLQVNPGLAKTLSVPESSPTIKGALIKAKAGDIILVSCGTYYEHDIVMKPGVALWSGTLQPGCVTIDAQGKGQIFVFSDADTNTALVGFTLRGGTALQTKVNSGGAIYCKNSSPRISNCVFQDNLAHSGGALSIDANSSPVLSNCLFENNGAEIHGGGVFCQGGVNFKQCAFVGNTSLIGGAINLQAGANAVLTSCSLRNNSAGNTGGALHSLQAHCEITNTIFSDNWGGIGGSAISCTSSEIKLVRSTLYRNSSDSDGGVLAVKGDKPQLMNTIIAFSKSAILRADSGVPEFKGCNLYGNENGDWVANLRSVGKKNNNISQDPQFCAPEYGNFNLNNSSACLPGNNPSGNKKVVGAFGAGCASAGNIPENRRDNASGFQAVQAGF